MFIKDHCGFWSQCISTLLQKLRQMSSKSHHLKTFSGIPSGPALLPSLSDISTFLNSSRVNGLSSISKASYTGGIVSSGYSTFGVLSSNLLNCVNRVLTLLSRLSPDTSPSFFTVFYVSLNLCPSIAFSICSIFCVASSSLILS